MGAAGDSGVEDPPPGDMKFGRSLRSVFWRGRVEDEVDAELDFHIEMKTRELVARGMDPASARALAVRRFGDIRNVNAVCRDIGRRRNNDMRRREYFSELRHDVVFAVRQLLRNPGFTAVALVTLALGLGATTAIFSAVHAVVLRPLPFPEPRRIVGIYETWQNRNRGNVSIGNFLTGVVPASSFSHVTAVSYSSFNIGDAQDVERIIGARVTGGFFDVFGIPPTLGRPLTDADDRPGHEDVAVLSYRLWMRRFAGDRNVVGTDIRLTGRPYRVVGVMPASFDYAATTEELWVPMAFPPARRTNYDEHFLNVFGRLRDGVTFAQAVGELERIGAELRQRVPRENNSRGLTAAITMDMIVGDYPRRLYTLLGAVAFVLLIACGNVANLLLARGAARSSELAIRAALGAGRGRIVRQLLTESLVLAALSAAAGIALAGWGIRALVAAAPPNAVPRLEQTSLDPFAVAFAVAVAVLSAVLFGLAPALRAARIDVHSALKAGGRGAMGGIRDRLRTGLIVAELALALLLLAGAGLLIRSSLALQRVDPGFEPSRVLSARMALGSGRDATAGSPYADPEMVVRTFERIVDAARSIPGVHSAAVTTQVPMGPGGNSNGLLPEGKPFDPANAIDSRLRVVSAGYFEVMGIPLRSGRGFTAADRRGTLKVMVISDTLARLAFPGQDPIGRRIACCEAGPDGQTPDYKTVIGVAADVYSAGPAATVSAEFYLPIAQAPAAAWAWNQRTMYVVLRTQGEPELAAEPLRRVVSEIAPGIPLFQVRPMEERLRLSIAPAAFNTLLLTILGVIGAVLAAVGIYGVIAYFVTRRTHEIGVRMALGASRGDVVRLIVGEAALPIAIGLVLGVAASLVATRALENQLFGVSRIDPLTLAVVVFTLGAVGLLASAVPARRAASVDPTRALHTN